jgi:ABC-type nitrate/sulfonate/bicarbonate transport system substrate-binding protein
MLPTSPLPLKEDPHMHVSPRKWLVAVLLAATVAVVAGTSTSASVRVGTPSPKLATPTTISMLKVPYFALEQIAAAKGYFQKYNLTVNFITQSVQGLAGISAIVGGQVATGQGFGFPSPVLAMANGAPIKAVFAGGLSDYGDYRMYTKVGGPITQPSDLIGKTVGVVNLGAYPDLALQVWLYKNHVPLDKVNRISVPLPVMCNALLSGQVDAAMMYALYWKQCQATNGSDIKLWFKDSDVLPSGKLYESYVFTNDYISQHPDIIRAWVAAMKDASAYVKAHPQDSANIISNVFGIPANLIIPQNQPPGNCVNPSAVAAWVQLMKNYNAIPTSVNYKTLFTNQFNPVCATLFPKPKAKKG